MTVRTDQEDPFVPRTGGMNWESLPRAREDGAPRSFLPNWARPLLSAPAGVAPP